MDKKIRCPESMNLAMSCYAENYFKKKSKTFQILISNLYKTFYVWQSTKKSSNDFQRTNWIKKNKDLFCEHFNYDNIKIVKHN